MNLCLARDCFESISRISDYSKRGGYMFFEIVAISLYDATVVCYYDNTFLIKSIKRLIAT